MSNTRAAKAPKTDSKPGSSVPAANLGPLQIKGTTVPALIVMIDDADPQRLAQAVSEKLAEVGERFSGELAVIDLSRLSQTDCVVDLAGLLEQARRFGMNPVAVRGAPEPIETAARDLRLGVLPAFELPRRANEAAAPATVPAANAEQPRSAPASIAANAAPTERGTKEQGGPMGALTVDTPLRSGQRVYARGRDLVVLAGVNPGAEVIADGSIHCYGPLRGRAAAGASGDAAARIYAGAFEAELISIAGVYKNFEQIPDELRGKALKISLDADSAQPRIVFDRLA